MFSTGIVANEDYAEFLKANKGILDGRVGDPKKKERSFKLPSAAQLYRRRQYRMSTQ